MPRETVVYRGGVAEWAGDEEITNVVIAEGVTEVRRSAFNSCIGLSSLSFLGGSGVTTVGPAAFQRSGIVALRGMEGVRRVGIDSYYGVFEGCRSLRTIEGLACEEMGTFCFEECTSLESMKGWPGSMTVIPGATFCNCTGMTAVDCDLSRVASVGVDAAFGRHAFVGCTSLLPPSLSAEGADPAAVLAHLKRQSFLERAPLRYAIYASVLVARKQEGRKVAERRRASPLASRLALLPKEMAREIVEFAHGVVQR
jgi:hypothetical protein